MIVRKLTQEHLKDILKYCPLTGNWMWIKPSKYGSKKPYDKAGYMTKRKKPFGTSCYYGICIDNKKYYLHSLAFLYMNGLMPSQCVDHINGDSLDNSWFNLREASYTQNAMNKTFKTKKSELPMGVHKKRNKYKAVIWVDKIPISLGCYNTIEEAHSKYIEARREYYGDFNRL